MTEWQGDEAHRRELGRLAFVLLMAVTGVFLAIIGRPRRGALGAAVGADSQSMLARSRHLWYGAAVLAPLTLAVLALVGYYYTAMQLHVRFVATLGILFGAIFVHALLIRWLTLAQARLAIWRARQNLAAKAVADAAPVGEQPAPKDGGRANESRPIDIATINEQTRQFLLGIIVTTFVICLWIIWAGVLPALRVLDDVPLWNHTVNVAGQIKLTPVTLKDLGLAMLVGALTFVAARNLPGAMEITILRRMRVDAGARYALSSISRYIIVTIGVLVTCNFLGVSWPDVQWLLAALTVGLGFGLQEIFANFVSGLIILIERPVRVGDTVTVGGVSGVVARIRIRATTITDWNQKELIVPNKKFITEDVVNWTLSDPLTRLIVPVGIAYGSDTPLALKVMQEAARGVATVQTQPEPEVYFLGFGDNSLNFEIRVFVREMTNKGRTKVIHALHMAVDEAFRKHNIVIAFPQRDLHLRTSETPITVRLATDGHGDTRIVPAGPDKE